MLKNWILVMTYGLVVLFSGMKGNPTMENIKNESKDLRVSPRIGTDWINFRGTWFIPSFPSIGSFFSQERNDEELALVKMRMQSLERGQKKIMVMVNQIVREVAVLGAFLNDKVKTNKEPEKPILQVESVNKEEDENIWSTIAVTFINEKEYETTEKDEEPEVTTQPAVIEDVPTQAPI